MKLKLDVREQAKVLWVSEGVALKDVAILKAGLPKIIQSSASPAFVVIDLTGATIPDPAVTAELLSLRTVAAGLGAFLLFASASPQIADAANADEALSKIAGTSDPKAELDFLKAQLNQLKKTKAELEKNFQEMIKKSGDVQSLRKQKTLLLRQRKKLESLLRDWRADRLAQKDPEVSGGAPSSDVAAEKRKALIDLLQPILQKEKLT